MLPQSGLQPFLISGVLAGQPLLRVALATADPHERRRLASLLSAFDDLSIVDCDSADVTLASIEGICGPAPVLALVHDEAAAARAMTNGAHGAILSTAGGTKIHAALHAIAEGLFVTESGGADAALPAGATPALLTVREQEVMELLAAGLANKEIAQRLGITQNTVKFHVNGILGKLGVESRTEAVVQAARLGIVSLL